MKIKIDTEHDELVEAVAAAQTGEEVVLVKDDQPVARIVPVGPAGPMLGPRKTGSARGLFTVPDDFDAPLDFGAPPVLPDRVPGSARGLVIIHDDFDDPLEDFRNYL